MPTPPGPGRGDGQHPIMSSPSLTARSPGNIPQSPSGRHLRRVSTGTHAPATPAMIASRSFPRSPRPLRGVRSAAAIPATDKSPTHDSRKRTTTDHAAPTPPSSRMSPSNLAMTRPTPTYHESASLYEIPQERSYSLRRARDSASTPEPWLKSGVKNGLPESFKPAKHVFDQSTIRPRPWRVGDAFEGPTPSMAKEASYCSDNSVPPEQTDAYETTEQSLREAIKAVTMLTMDVVVKILDSGILLYVPIPGLEAVAQVLVRTWTIVRTVSNNRLRMLRLTQRCAHILLSIKEDVQDAGERVHSSLQRALDTLLRAFDKVRVLAETQKEAPFLKRLLGRKEIEGQFAGCDEELNNALKLFSLSVQISTMKLVQETTDNLRKQNDALASQNHELLLLCSPRPSNHSTESVEQTLSTTSSTTPPSDHESIEARFAVSVPASDSTNNRTAEVRRSRSPNTSRPVVHRATASSRSKQVASRRPSPEPRAGIQIPTRTASSSSRRRNTSKDSSPSRRYPSEPNGLLDPGEDLMARIIDHQRMQNEFDHHGDMADFRQLIKETLDAGKDSFIIKLLQIDVKDFPQAIVVLQHELHEHQNGTGKSNLPLDDPELHQHFIRRGVDAMKRMTQSDDIEQCQADWTINKFKILELETIGYGSFSTVRRGLWNNQVVAIKILSPKTKRTVFENEMRIWKGLSHPNILPLFGASNAMEEPLFFVSLYAKHGNLVDFLHALRQRDLEGVFGTLLRDVSANAEVKKKHWRKKSNSLMREQAHHNRWYGNGSPSNVDIEKFYTLPLSKSDSKFNRCHVLKDGDIFRFMLDIALGMEYLHENGVLHGDLKASNILVNNDLSGVISDFGQSERRTDIYRASGWTPKGTARWKAPELLVGSGGDLTSAVDVYAFAITCIEIMSMGGVPWGSTEDSFLSHRIVVENLRPPIPSDFKDSGLEPLFDAWWNRDPDLRPEFREIVGSVQALLDEAEEGALEDVRRKSQKLGMSPPMLSPEFRKVTEHIPMTFEQSPIAPSPSSADYQDTGKSYYQPAWVSSDFSDTHLSPSSLEYDQYSSSSSNNMPTPMRLSSSLTESSRVGWEAIESPQYGYSQSASSLPGPSTFTETQPERHKPSGTVHVGTAGIIRQVSEDDLEPSFVRIDFDESSPEEISSLVQELNLQHEKIYRRVEHEFHWTLRIPLWNPVAVQVADVGYMHPTTREFVTLFNAFRPFHDPSDSSISIPSIQGFGDPVLKHTKISTQKSRKLFRTFTYKLYLQEGRPMAHCFCESPDWDYLQETKPPLAWLKASADTIVRIHANKHGITRGDLLLVVGSLQASRYSLFISSNHPTGSVEFTANSGKKGRAWGSFDTDMEPRSSTSSKGYDGDYAGTITANRISEVSGPPKALFLAALRFPQDALAPTLV
ncbi:TKL/TKL-ccin protein kinase [Ephemerocybe angulata]|uniref:TKL/TKL-ccin protein kinase n=1 Tax=Ephemerocybe angulata TaxID=980116 RepID=A0A8H6HP23_9AGAR|nr:TKL/TKL-ccin protein kinase [Tulosesus angulatus]